MGLLREFGTNLWTVEGPVVDFYGFPYTTRMAVVKLEDGSAWLWSPVLWSEELASEIESSVGPIRHLVSPNKLHWLFLKGWQEKYPSAIVYASPGLRERDVVNDVRFDKDLSEEPDPSFAADIEQVIMRSDEVLDEVIFFHKPSKTVIICDYIQRFPEGTFKGFKGWLMKADGLVGPKGGAPRELRLIMWLNGSLPEARVTLDKIISWLPEKLIIAHGENATENAVAVLEQSFSWIPLQPRTERFSCLAPLLPPPKGDDKASE